jgi:hypothetical protein
MGAKMFTSINKLTVSIFLILILTYTSRAQLSGSINVGSGQTYTSLTGSGASGFFNTVNTVGLSGNVTVLITSDITESGSVALNQWAVGSGFTITITPSSAAVYTLQSNNSTTAFSLNGADNVTFNGNFSGSGRYLRFVNTNTSGTTFRFTNDATGNTITNCIIEGTNSTSNEGVIEFTTTSGANGNDNNTISNCLIRDNGGTTPQNMIYSSGSTTTTATYNSGNTISNNEIYNFYRNGQTCCGVLLAGGTTDWTISGNSFYQTSTRTATTAVTYNVIFVNTSGANNITISGNYLGGTAASCGGTAWTLNGTVSNAIYFIRFSAAGTTTASNVNGNFIQNISFSSQPSASGVVHFAGILVESGSVNVGNTTGNTIGNSSTTGNITLTYTGSTSNIINRGIDHRRLGQISNNTVGSVNVGGTNNSLIRFESIYYANNPASPITISNNTIGSTTTANSIHASNSSQYVELAGIYSNASGGTINITGNTISNITNTSTNTGAYLRGIFQTGNNVTLDISNNTVMELVCSGTSTSRAPTQSPAIGIITASTSDFQTISGNTIHGIRANGNAGTYVSGFGHSSNVSTGTFSRNKIYDITNSSTSGTAKIWAVNAYWGSWGYYNNQVTVTNGEASDYVQHNPAVLNENRGANNYFVDVNNIPEGFAADVLNYGVINTKPEIETDASTNDLEIKGIHDEAEFACTYYYNTVYIGGSQSSGANNSWAYDRPLSSWPTPVTMRNNIFFNARTGGTGKHYALGNEIGATNWGATASNYNVLIASNSATIATWGAADQTIDQWRTSSSCDKHTWSTTSGSLSASNLFQGISSGNLNINTGNYEAWIVTGKGIAISGQSTDFEGTTRPTAVTSGTSDIGADEFTATPPNNPAATVDNAPGSGVTSNYTLWSRTIVTIDWGTGGSSYPSSVNVNYYSGVNPSNVSSGNYSNSYWSVNPVGSLTGTTYDIRINFGDNETYTITTPSVNTRLSKYESSFWFVYVASGNGPSQTELNYANTWAKTRSINSFSDYALTDETSPMPVEMCSFDAAVLKRDVQLSWSTCSELNNMGFDVERRAYNPVTNDYYPWIKTGFVEGSGTTNQQQFYKYNDNRLATGKYQYRLKQIDYNGNFEYHNLASPSEVSIGTPLNADLFQNYPNPSNPSAKVDFQIPFAGKVSLKVYDITGKEVATLVEAEMDAGYYTSEFNGSNLASGVYFYRLIASSNTGNSFNKTMKLILVK